MPQNLTRMNPGAAAIDIGSTMHMAAVNPVFAEMPKGAPKLARTIVDNDRGATAIFAGTALVTDLSLDPGKPCQTRNPVRAAHLCPVEKVVVQLAPLGDCVAIACRPRDSHRPCRSPAKPETGDRSVACSRWPVCSTGSSDRRRICSGAHGEADTSSAPRTSGDATQ